MLSAYSGQTPATTNFPPYETAPCIPHTGELKASIAGTTPLAFKGGRPVALSTGQRTMRPPPRVVCSAATKDPVPAWSRARLAKHGLTPVVLPQPPPAYQ